MCDVQLLGKAEFVIESKLDLSCYSSEVDFPFDVALFIFVKAVLQHLNHRHCVVVIRFLLVQRLIILIQSSLDQSLVYVLWVLH